MQCRNCDSAGTRDRREDSSPLAEGLRASRRGDRSPQKSVSVPYRYGASNANTQGATLEEAPANFEEAVTLVLEANRRLAQETISGQDVI